MAERRGAAVDGADGLQARVHGVRLQQTHEVRSVGKHVSS